MSVIGLLLDIIIFALCAIIFKCTHAHTKLTPNSYTESQSSRSTLPSIEKDVNVGSDVRRRRTEIFRNCMQLFITMVFTVIKTVGY